MPRRILYLSISNLEEVGYWLSTGTTVAGSSQSRSCPSLPLTDAAVVEKYTKFSDSPKKERHGVWNPRVRLAGYNSPVCISVRVSADGEAVR